MAYSTANPPAEVWQTIGGGTRCWVYKSTDAIATVNTANYFTNGGTLGMKVNDVIYIVDTTNGLVDIAVVNATGNGTVDITNGLRITETDSD